MRRRHFYGFVLGLLALAMSPALSAQTKPLSSRQNNEGQVTVTVTPSILSGAADTWRFEVQLNTHVAPPTQDLAAVSSLSDGKGHDQRAVAWQGDPPGGHHRKGVLVFKPITPAPESVMLKIREVGGVPERTFTWKLSNP